MGKKVLAVDFDSHANLTTCFGIEDTRELENTIGHLMMAEMEDAKLRLEMGTEKMLSGILEPLREKYDYILIDTCPSLGTLTMCETRSKLCRVLTEEVEESFQEQIRFFETKIPNTVKVGKSIYYNLPVVQYSPKTSAGVAYRKFAKELISYEG